MGNHRMEHHQPRVNTTSLIMLEMTIIESWKQPTEIGII
jgi:hypothetical protein